MMKNVLLVSLLSLLFTNMTCNRQNSTTPREYRNTNRVNHNLYLKDSVEAFSVLKLMLKKNLHPFRPEKQFDSNTSIFLDSIIYSPDKLKMVVFVITKNSTNKLSEKEGKEPYFYNANYLFCSRETKDSSIKIYDYAAFNLVYYYSYNEIKKRLNEYCFLDLGQQKENKYNLDDLRFWQSDDFKWVSKNFNATQIQ
jgi:hypothetical protein